MASKTVVAPPESGSGTRPGHTSAAVEAGRRAQHAHTVGDAHAAVAVDVADRRRRSRSEAPPRRGARGRRRSTTRCRCRRRRRRSARRRGAAECRRPLRATERPSARVRCRKRITSPFVLLPVPVDTPSASATVEKLSACAKRAVIAACMATRPGLSSAPWIAWSNGLGNRLHRRDARRELLPAPSRRARSRPGAPARRCPDRRASP